MSKKLSSRTMAISPLLWVMLFDHTSLNISFPVLTLLFFDSHSSLFAADTSHAVRSMWYGLCISIPHFINLGTTPILSALSDEFGRKKILLLGTLGAFLFALTAALGVLWGSLGLLFVGRIIQGAFSRTNPIGQAIIGDISSRIDKIRHMGYLQTAISIGACIGPMIGGYFANKFLFTTFNFSLPYFIAAIFGGTSFILTLILFQETLAVRRQTAILDFFRFNKHKHIFFDKRVLLISLLLLFSQISWSLYYQFMPPILKTHLGFAAQSLGFFIGLIAFWLAFATSFGILALQRYFSLRQIFLFSLYLVFLGLCLSAVYCGAYFQQTSTLGVYLAAIPTAMGDVIAYSCIITLYSNVVAKEEQGRIMGICFIVVALIWALTGMLGGAIMSYDDLMPLIMAPVGILLTLMIVHSRYGKNIIHD